MKKLFYYITSCSLFKLDLKIKITALLGCMSFLGLQAETPNLHKHVALDLKENKLLANKERLLYITSSNLQTQLIEIRGIVKEAGSGLPIMGANILEKGTTNGIMTDFDGDFTLEVSQNATLVISFVGFATQEVQLDGKTTLEIVLESQAADLDEVLLVGYKSQKKSELTSSVSNIKAEDLKDVTTPDVAGMLQGKAAGVQVLNSGGQPGEAPVVNIRGLSSINGSTDPLWVVDGVAIHGTPNINPNEVASVNILKDASGTALYGSRGANGVVVVTTKSGTVGETVVSVTSKTGVSNFSSGNLRIMNAQQLYDYYQNFGNPERIPEDITQDVTNTNYNWLDNATQTGLIQDYNISITGGSEKTKTFMSLGYYNETGTVKGYEYDRLSMRLNVDHAINDKLTFKPKFSVNYTGTDDQQHSIRDVYNNLPWDAPYDDEGTIVDPQTTGVEWYGRDQKNYLYDLQWNYEKENTFNMISNFDIEYKISSNLTFISTNNMTLYYQKGNIYTDPKSNLGLAIKGGIEQSNSERITRFTNQMLRYSNTFGKHNLNALLAY